MTPEERAESIRIGKMRFDTKTGIDYHTLSREQLVVLIRQAEADKVEECAAIIDRHMADTVTDPKTGVSYQFNHPDLEAVAQEIRGLKP